MDNNEKHAISRYREIAGKLMSQIDAGVFGADQRLPSVRSIMQRENVSVTTAVRAFRMLEENGRVYARDRSGYFVRARTSEADWNQPAPPHNSLTASNDPFDGVPVAVNQLVVDMLATSGAPHILSLSSAVLDRLLIPQSQLSRILISIAQHDAGASASYTAPPGLFELRCAIARIMGDRGVLCGPDDIIVTAGDSAGMEYALRILARPGDSIAIETPTYFGILQAIESAGMKAVPIITSAATGIDLDQLELAVQSDKIACVLLNPTLHNPLGFTMPTANRKRLAAILAKARIPLIEDDVFHDLYSGTEPLVPIKRFDRDGMVLYCSSFSKVLTPGYRVGWCLPGRYRRQMMDDMLGHNISISSLPQLVLSEFLRKNYYEAHTAKLRALFADVPQKVAQLIGQHFPPGTRVSQPQGGFVYWLELPTPLDINALYVAAVADGVSIAPGTIFFASGISDTTFRLCIGRQWTARVELSIAHIGRLCSTMETGKRLTLVPKLQLPQQSPLPEPVVALTPLPQR